jgi:hypothetical protein
VTPSQRLVAAWSGAVAAPLLWAATTQSGQILPSADCAHGHRSTAITALTSTILALLSALVCWRSRGLGRPGRFACTVGGLLGLVFAFAILLQAIASVILTGCER